LGLKGRHFANMGEDRFVVPRRLVSYLSKQVCQSYCHTMAS
jgi:hypothetical protein